MALTIILGGAGSAAAITRSSTSTVVNSTATSVVSVPAPPQTQSGDVLVACLALNGGGVVSSQVPSGWKPIATVTTISNPHVFGYYKVAGGSEPASYSWTLTSSVANGAGVARYSGVDTAGPLDSTVATASGAATTSATVAGVTTTSADAMLAGCVGINSSSTAVTISAPSGMTAAWNIGGKRHQLADGPQATAGPGGPRTWTFSASRAWAGWLVALRPATAGAPAGAPTNASPPTVGGTPAVGGTLTVSPGSWTSDSTISGYAYRWQTSSASSGGSWVNATGAGAATGSYTVAAADAGLYLRVVETATNAVGSASAASVATAMVPPYDTALPAACAAPAVGVACTATNGTWAGASSYSYQWQTNSVPSGGSWSNATGSGATTAGYTPAATDEGRFLRVVVTATNAGGSTSAPSPASAPVAAGAASSLVALWHMDETSGTAMYDSARSHTGTLRSVQVGLPGFSGTAYGFTGAGYVTVPSAADLNPGSADLTITIHLKATGVPATPDWDLIRKGEYATPGGEFKVEYQPSGQATCGFKGSASYSDLAAGPPLNDGVWHKVQCVKTATAIKLIVDGQTFTKPANIGTIANTSAIAIGSHYGSELFRGSLDEASIQIG